MWSLLCEDIICTPVATGIEDSTASLGDESGAMDEGVEATDKEPGDREPGDREAIEINGEAIDEEGIRGEEDVDDAEEGKKVSQ